MITERRHHLPGRLPRPGRRHPAQLLPHARAPRSTPSPSTAWTTPSGSARGSSQVCEDADRDPRLIEQGALNFVIIGGGATGVETAGAIADLVNDVMPERYHDLAVHAARVHVVDLGHVVLAPFTEGVHEYAAKVLARKGVQLHLGVSAKEIAADKVVLSDGTSIPTRTVVWAGGLLASPLAAASGLPQGRGGRVEVEADLTVDGHPGVYVLGDMSGIPGADGESLPQLGSVGLQSGVWAADEHRGRHQGQAPQAVPLPRQRHHGHDRQERGRGRDGRQAPRAPRRRSPSPPGSGSTPGS